MPQQPVGSGFLGKNPVVEIKSQILCRKSLGKPLAAATFHKHLLGREIAQQLVDVVGSTLGSEKFPCTYVKECHATCALPEIYGGKKIIFTIVENIVVNRYSGSNQLGYASLDKFLGKFGIF